ncbi:MAG: hypothetical protein IKZ46_05490 [Victivallales bacterium]|nr:hypothetical protein [Victivallales bacterium]
MKKTVICLLLAFSFAATAQIFTFQNKALGVSFSTETGAFTVLDKRSDRVFVQPAKFLSAAPPSITATRSPNELTVIDVDYTMTGHANNITDDADCSFITRLDWNEKYLILQIAVRDDILAFPAPKANWWFHDSIEFWINKLQLAVYPAKQGDQTLLTFNTKAPMEKSSATTVIDTPGSYLVTVHLDWTEIGIEPKIGAQFRFAIGVNDADNMKGQRDGQLYYPSTWVHSDINTYANVTLSNKPLPVVEPLPPVDNARRIPNANGVIYTWRQPGQPDCVIRAELIEDRPELKITTTAVGGNIPLERNLPSIPGFILDAEEPVIACSDTTSGHIYPLSSKPFTWSPFGLGGDLPFIAITDLKTGEGYGILADTPDDAVVSMKATPLGAKSTTCIPQVAWMPTLKHFGKTPRVYRFVFVDKGGYVTVAKAFRAWAQKNGYLVTLRKKAWHNPNVNKLMGAADVWDGNNLEFCKLAKSYGIDKLLINGQFNANDMKQAASMGYLLGKYDVYTDIYNNKETITAASAPLPGHAVQKADGTIMKAWTTFDGSRTSWKRCTSLIPAAAQICMPPDLAQYPYEARFLDVTTSEGLYECYNPDHPMTRSDKRRYSEETAHYMANWQTGYLNLVTGGEHGKWWCAKDMHYVEGMQSGGHANYSWPAGHLKRPESKTHDPRNPDKPTNAFTTRYEVYGVGPKYRVPLWDLVFHDCITTTWYWGDSTDFLIKAAPEITPRKDAFNVLYASMPMYWMNKQGLWKNDRDAFLRSYFHATKVHEAIGMEEMTAHYFLNDDRTVQMTSFADGTDIIVNMDPIPQSVTLKGREYLLPCNGFAVDGPQIKQELVLDDDLFVSKIRTDNFFFSCKSTDLNPRMDGTTSVKDMLIVKADKPDMLHIVSIGEGKLPIDDAFLKRWDLKTTIVYELDDNGNRQNPFIGSLDLPHAGRYIALCGEAALKPDYIAIFDITSNTDDNPDSVTLLVANRGLASPKVTIKLYADRIAKERLISESVVNGIENTNVPIALPFALPTDKLAGRYKIIAVVDAQGDLAPENNIAEKNVNFFCDTALYSISGELLVPAIKADSKLEPYEAYIDFTVDGPLPFAIDPSSIRVISKADSNGSDSRKPCLPYVAFVPDKDYNGKKHAAGTIYFSYDAHANLAHTFTVVASDQKFLPQEGCHFDKGATPGTGRFKSDSYVAVFGKATLNELRPVTVDGEGPNFIKSIHVSSQETGWASEEKAELKRFDVLLNTPAKCVILASQKLKNGATYVKTYTFYPGRFTIEADLDKPAGSLFSRAFYATPGIYLDDKNHTVDMATTTDGANISGQNPNPKWYAVRGNGWAHSCIALSDFTNISFWDPTGQIGFASNKLTGNKFAYFIYPEQKDFSFAENDYQRTRK